ncbi:hypothetical protein N7513_002759 [Penicillium frequentans]|nr:hypothetical protein N7513_002759 [Penicillium glabrum]
MPGDSPTSIPGLDLQSSGDEQSPSPISSPTSMLGPDSQSSGDENTLSYTPQDNTPAPPPANLADEGLPDQTLQLERKRKLSPVSESSGHSNKNRKTDSRAESTMESPKLEIMPSHPGKDLSPSATQDIDLDSLPRATTPDALPSPIISDLSEVSQLLEDDEEVVAAPEDDHSSVYEDVPLPKVPVYDPGLQRGLGDVRKQLSRLADIMQLSDLMIDQGSILKELRPEAEDLSKFKYPESRTVGFIGTSGEGKSSVINSLLDKMNLSRASGSGSACTSVVTEFRYVDDGHPGPELSSGEDQDKLRDAASRAEETLESLFQSQPEWDREFLADDTEGAEVAILAKLQEWAQIAVSLRPGGHDSLVYTATAKNLQQCTDKLNYLVADSHESGQPALWPFIKLLRVYLKSPILRPGLVVADLPGFRDMNYARVRATEKYLSRNCDEVFIVSNIARCLSDQSIPDIMRRCRTKPWHIVCTKSDAIYLEEQSRGKTPYAEKMRNLVLKLKKANALLNKLRTKVRSTPLGSEGNSEVVELIDTIEGLEMKLTRLMVERRNDGVKRAFKKKYPGVGVFCVSNTLYATYRTSEHRLANDYITLSEIRELREHCQMVPAAAQLRMIEAYLNHQVPAFLSSLRQWALAGADSVTEERAAALRTAISQVDATIRKEIVSTHGCVESTKRELTDLFETNILQLIGQSETVWTEKCVTLSEQWATWHHSTYSAFCRHNGTWKGASVGYQSWNEDLIEQAQGQLGPRFNSISQWLKSQAISLTNAAEDIFERVLALLRLYEPHAPQALGNLFSCMERRKQNIIFEIGFHLKQMIQSTDSTSDNMINGHDSSMMADLMRPAYLKCANYAGKGSFKLRRDAFHDHVKIHDSSSITTPSQKQLKKVARDLSMVVAAEGEIHEAEQKPTLAQDVKVGIETAQGLLERAQFDLGTAKERN